MKKEKILIVGGFPPKDSKIFGGIVTSCKALIESSFSQKFKITTIDSTQKSNPIPHFIIRLLFAVKRTHLYLAKLIFNRPKLVILFPSIGASLFEKSVMCWMAFFLRIPVFMFPRGGPLLDQVKDSKFTRIWVRFAFAGATKILCQGPAWKKFAKDILKFSDYNTPIVYNWTATDDLLHIGKNKLKYFNSENLNFLYLGWIEEEKGIFDFLQAFKEIELKDEFKITIAGGGTGEAFAREYVDINGMNNFVNFEGWVDGAGLESIFKKSDVLILPSWAEGFPNAVIEAMASGLAVIVSSVGNIPDILSNESEAIIIPPKDIDALKNAIIRLSEDHELRKSISNKGYSFASKKFSVEEAALKLEKLIISAIK